MFILSYKNLYSFVIDGKNIDKGDLSLSTIPWYRSKVEIAPSGNKEHIRATS